MDGDVYAEKPYLYGPAGSSVNLLHVGNVDGGKGVEKYHGEDGEGLVFGEGGDEEGCEARSQAGIPDTDAARKKWFLNEENRKGFEWEAGRGYGCDFFNPYLDFNGAFPPSPSAPIVREPGNIRRCSTDDVLDFALRLPGFTLPIMKYWDGQGLRCVLFFPSFLPSFLTCIRISSLGLLSFPHLPVERSSSASFI